MPTPGEIDHFHSQLSQLLTKELAEFARSFVERPSFTIEIADAGITDWKRIATNQRRIPFHLRLSDYYHPIVNDLGHSVVAVPLSNVGNSSTSWCSWYEEWLCLDKGAFDLVGAGWTFYVGVEPHTATQVLRAEWDHVLRRGGKGGQPHWHVDTKIPLVDVEPYPTGAADDSQDALVEIEPLNAYVQKEIGAPPRSIGRSAMHLAMAGWNQPGYVVKCERGTVEPVTFGKWQQLYTNTDLKDWAVAVAKYVRQEIENIRIAHA